MPALPFICHNERRVIGTILAILYLGAIIHTIYCFEYCVFLSCVNISWLEPTGPNMSLHCTSTQNIMPFILLWSLLLGVYTGECRSKQSCFTLQPPALCPLTIPIHKRIIYCLFWLFFGLWPWPCSTVSLPFRCHCRSTLKQHKFDSAIPFQCSLTDYGDTGLWQSARPVAFPT